MDYPVFSLGEDRDKCSSLEVVRPLGYEVLALCFFFLTHPPFEGNFGCLN